MPSTSRDAHLKATRKLLIERRDSLRFPCNLWAVCRIGAANSGVDWPARVHNLSCKGAGLVLVRSHPPGTRFAVRFLRAEETCLQEMQVIYVHAERNAYYHGCAFIRHLRQEEVDELVR